MHDCGCYWMGLLQGNTKPKGFNAPLESIKNKDFELQSGLNLKISLLLANKISQLLGIEPYRFSPQL